MSSTTTSTTSSSNDDSLVGTKKKTIFPLTKLQHAASTLALCIVAFTHSYLLISVFPYSGFMAIELIDSATVESAGSYAGLIASSFMVGRSISAVGWGKYADRYGRKSSILVSLVLSAIFTILFGLARSFPLALFWRFMLGLSNGLITAAKTAVSELANGDKDLEANSMNIVMMMWGGAFLIAPAISGAVAEPVRLYGETISWLSPDSHTYFDWLRSFLTERPFFLPNLIGAGFCVLGGLFTHWFVVETLPQHILQPFRRIPEDITHSLQSLYRTVFPSKRSSRGTGVDERTPIVSPHKKYIQYDEEKSEGKPDLHFELSEDVLKFLEEDAEDAIRESRLYCDETVNAVLTTKARRSIVSNITRRSSLKALQHRRVSRLSDLSFAMVSQGPESKTENPSIGTFWKRKDIRRHITLYSIVSFLIVSLDEAFPLFCLSMQSGLGLNENKIGGILSASGIIFLVVQTFIYAPILDRMGLYGSIRFGTILMPPLAVMIPLSIGLMNKGSHGQGELSWAAFAFLATNLALARVAGSFLFSGMTVTMNRLVEANQRATLNGLVTLLGSVSKSLGPACAGILVAFFFSSGIFAPHLAAFLLYLTFAGIACVGAVYAVWFLEEKDDEDVAVQLTT